MMTCILKTEKEGKSLHDLHLSRLNLVVRSGCLKIDLAVEQLTRSLPLSGLLEERYTLGCLIHVCFKSGKVLKIAFLKVFSMTLVFCPRILCLHGVLRSLFALLAQTHGGFYCMQRILFHY